MRKRRNTRGPCGRERSTATVGTGLVAALALAAGIAQAVPGSPNAGGGSTEKTGHGFGWINPSAGMYQDDIDVDVPDFDGLEPDVGLSYSSAGGNGYVGAGWALGGFSVIERAGAARGAPAYSPEDVWLLDGTMLRRCDEPHGPSVSCSHGGTHFPEQERFDRIERMPGATERDDRWRITERDGTMTTYEVVQTTADGRAYRLATSMVQDLDGNRTTYEWGSSLFGESWLFPRRIVYRTGQVDFHWEPRPDIETFADGVGLGQTRGRLKTIVVWAVDTNGPRRIQSAYRLRYTTGALTGRSLLASVQEFGTDAVLATDANGESDVVGGTSFPATQISYSGTSAADATTVNGDTGLGVWCAFGSGNGSSGQLEYAGDFDGDGRQDLGCRAAGVHYIAYSRSDATAQTTAFVDGSAKASGLCAGPWDHDQQLNGDYDGDGMTDLGCLSAGSVWVAPSTGNGFRPREQRATGWCSAGRAFTGDFDGDGASDLACRAGTDLDVRLSTRTGFAERVPWTQGWCAAPGYQFTGDFNGDGRTDVACRTAAPTPEVVVVLSKGAGAKPVSSWLTGWCSTGDGAGIQPDGTPTEYLYSGDFNGDGKEDLGCRKADGRQYVALSTGRSFVATTAPWDAAPSLCPTGAAGGRAYTSVNGQTVETLYAFQYPSDFNADGRTDLACRSGAQIYVGLSTGWGFSSPITLSPGCTNGTEAGTGGFPLMIVGDFDGDGRTDAACRQADGRHTLSLVSQAVPDLLTRITNGFGGSLEVRYRVATSWPDTRGLRGMTVERIRMHDGRSAPADTTFAYAGGRYDPRNKVSLGFAVVRTTAPPIGDAMAAGYGETTFHQTYTRRGLPDATERRSSRGMLLERVEHVYSHDGENVPPYRVHETGQRQLEVFDGAAARTCDAEATAYDEFGNATEQIDLGDCDVPGDEITTRTTYVPNRTTFLVSQPAVVAVYAGVGATALLLDETRIYYDDNATHLVSPNRGRVTRVDERTNETAWSTTLTAYDVRGNPTRVTDPMGAVTMTAYDALDRPTTVTNPIGHQVTTTWDLACGAPATVTDPNGGVIRTTYDTLCRVALIEDPIGGVVRTAHVDMGTPFRQHVLTESTPAHGMSAVPWTRSYHDGLGRTYLTLRSGPTASEMIAVATRYDAHGNVVETSDAYYWDGLSASNPPTVKIVYDERGDAAETVYADGARSLVSRWLRDTTTTDPLGHRTLSRADGLGRTVVRGELLDRNALHEAPSARWLLTTYEYDGRGGLRRVTDPSGNVTAYERDWDGRVVREVDPDRGARTYVYDAKGRVVETTDALNQRTTFTYDALDRTITRTVRAGRSNAVVYAFEYDDIVAGGAAVGKLTRSSYGQRNSERYHYDANGRIDRYEREIDGIVYAHEYAYDRSGRLLRVSYPDGSYDTGAATAARRYDDAGRLAAIPDIVDELRYDAAGRLLLRRNTNGTATTYGYDARRGWLTSIQTTAGPTVLQSELRDVDADGRVRRISTRGVSPAAQPGPTTAWTFEYNSLHELLDATNDGESARSDGFAYDDIGNLVATARNGVYMYPPSGPGSVRPHAVSQMGRSRFKYDANGNMTRGRRLSIKYDGNQLPIKIRSMRYAYDADGQRYLARRGSRLTKFVTNDYEIAPDGTVTKYVKLDNDDSDGFSLAAKIVGAGAQARRYTLHADEQGSIEVVTDEAGRVVLRREYGPFGDVQWASSAFRQERGYTGHYHDDETGLIYMRARYYDPILARFLQPDDRVDGDDLLGLNRYAYVKNDPTNAIDPDGHAAVIGLLGEAGKTILGIIASEAVTRAIDQLLEHRYDSQKQFVKRHYESSEPGAAKIYKPKDRSSGLRSVVGPNPPYDRFEPVGGRRWYRNRFHYNLWQAKAVWLPAMRTKYGEMFASRYAPPPGLDPKRTLYDAWFQEGERYAERKHRLIRSAIISHHRRMITWQRIRQAKRAGATAHGIARARAALAAAKGARRTAVGPQVRLAINARKSARATLRHLVCARRHRRGGTCR